MANVAMQITIRLFYQCYILVSFWQILIYLVLLKLIGDL